MSKQDAVEQNKCMCSFTGDNVTEFKTLTVPELHRASGYDQCPLAAKLQSLATPPAKHSIHQAGTSLPWTACTGYLTLSLAGCSRGSLQSLRPGQTDPTAWPCQLSSVLQSKYHVSGTNAGTRIMYQQTDNMQAATIQSSCVSFLQFGRKYKACSLPQAMLKRVSNHTRLCRYVACIDAWEDLPVWTAL